MSKTLDRLQAVVEAATPGPWQPGPRNGYVKGPSATVADCRYKNGLADATFIATARNTYPEALAVVRAAADLEELGCIRRFWGARERCAEYDDGRELCAPCALSVALSAFLEAAKEPTDE